MECDGDCSAKAKKLLEAPQGSNWRWFQHSQLMKVHGVVTTPPPDVVDAPHTPDTDARPFDKNPSIAAPRRSTRKPELEGRRIEVKWVFDESDELLPATEENLQTYGDDDAVWYDAVVEKVRKKDVVVKYPDDGVTKHHNLLRSGITAASPAPYSDYLERDKSWRTKDT